MWTWIGRARWLALVVIVPLALTGCFRSAGKNLEPTPPGGVVPVAQVNTQAALPTNTPEQLTVEPTLGIVPTAEEATAFPTPIPTLSPFPTMPYDTETPPPTVEGQGGPLGPTSTPTVQAVVIAPTFTPQPTTVVVIVQPTSTPQPTFTSQPTYTPFVPAGAAVQPVQPAQVVPTQPQEAIPLGEQPTATLAAADGQGGMEVQPTPLPAVAQVATLTPSPAFIEPTQPPVPQGPTLTGGQMTATQIVYGATATMAFLMGTQLPPPTPFGAEGQQQPQIVQPGQIPPNATVITATPVGQPGMCAEHTVTIGETLYRIASAYGVTAQEIATANNITNPDLIEAGSTLQIPCPAAPTLTPVPAQQGTGATTTTGQPQVYIVQAGDNIYRISLKFGVDMAELVRLNGLNEVTMNSIHVGQELLIPASATVVMTPVPGAAVGEPTLTPYIIIVTPAPGSAG